MAQMASFGGDTAVGLWNPTICGAAHNPETPLSGRAVTTPENRSTASTGNLAMSCKQSSLSVKPDVCILRHDHYVLTERRPG